MRGKRKKRKIALAGILLAVVAAAVLYLAGRPKPLLQTARLFCVVRHWTGQPLAFSFNHYYWIGNNAAFIVTGVGTNTPIGLYRVASNSAGRAGIPVPLGFALPAAAGAEISVSPDGRLLAYVLPGSLQLVVRREDGTTIVHCDCINGARNEVTPFAWATDSQSIATLQFRPKACLVRVSIRTGRAEKIPLPPELPRNDLGPASLLGFTEHGTLLIARTGSSYQDRVFFNVVAPDAGSTANIPQIPLAEISLSGTPRIVRTFAPTVPAGAGSGLVVLSPCGDRLFWGALCANIPSPLQIRLHRYLSFVPGDTTVLEKGWVSRLDGSGMHELGYYEIPTDTPGAANPAGPPMIIDPKWTPDGKRISFVYKDRLLTIPAE